MTTGEVCSPNNAETERESTERCREDALEDRGTSKDVLWGFHTCPRRSRRTSFAIYSNFHIRHTTADPISTRKHILRLPQVNPLRTTSWHKGNVGSCGTNLLIPHSAKGLRLLDQPDHFSRTTCGTGARGSTCRCGEAGEGCK